MGLAERKLELGIELPSEALSVSSRIIEVGTLTKIAANDIIDGGISSPEELAPSKPNIASNYTRVMCRPPTASQCRPSQLLQGC